MSNLPCFYCSKDNQLDSRMIFICKLSGSDLYLNLNQSHLGRVIVASKTHVKEVFDLSKNERDHFMDDISLVSKVIHSIFCPDKLNYAIFGDIVSHLHMHIVPKYENKKSWGEPYNDLLPVFFSEAEYTELINRIRIEVATYKKK